MGTTLHFAHQGQSAPNGSDQGQYAHAYFDSSEQAIPVVDRLKAWIHFTHRRKSYKRAEKRQTARSAANLKSLGLTPAETKLALAVAQGSILQGYAKANGMNISTVRNLLKRVFAKAGVSRLIDLALLLKSIPTE